MNGLTENEVVKVPRKKQNIGENLETWVIKDVDNDTRRKVKIYAAANDLTTAQALKALVDRATDAERIIELLVQEIADLQEGKRLKPLVDPKIFQQHMFRDGPEVAKYFIESHGERVRQHRSDPSETK